ncbi:hypothetical protein CcrColossus_gp012 [Caulobacter phage CcrColossus]|uniref:Uncharacterized protein n=1 Tax=Caulobacter phage CcrColossus TaxID=1211640 RepID=K4K5Y9_9CAUD|nr:hypothetical protein CcrColossus_gp012 [Caulobacter phage CcrColossus]AFU87882.1 hypothetical protein CcrColossus_gp012 [Caulobacter phage CcrColossus]
MAQDRATGSDFNSSQEALDEHDALAFVADWLEAQGEDVSPIRMAQPSAERLAALRQFAADEEAERAALERTQGRFVVVHGVAGSPMGDRLPGRFETYDEAEDAAEPYRKPGTWAYVDELAS